MLTSLGEIAAAEASSVDGGGDNDDEELDAIIREGYCMGGDGYGCQVRLLISL